MELTFKCPLERPASLDEALNAIDSLETSQPFAPETLLFCAELSKALFTSEAAARLPEIPALAFWLRPAELKRLQGSLAALACDGSHFAPRGTVLHIPPANVGTMFAYSWVFSLLAGNASVIRLPSGASPAISAVLAAINSLLARKEHASVAAGTLMLAYSRDEEITAALSLKADVRVLWGGNETVARLRRLPLPPHAKELVFPDRYSMSALKAAVYLGLNQERREKLAQDFFNDSYWFQQQACSSPRLVLWCGSVAHCETAGRLFFQELEKVIERKGIHWDASSAMAKLTFIHSAAIDEPVAGCRRWGNELAVLTASDPAKLSRRHCGSGLFFDTRLERLEDLLSFVSKDDQTLTHFGFSPLELSVLPKLLGGRGLCRIVPIGEALRFHRYWDGYDLLQEMLQRVYVEN